MRSYKISFYVPISHVEAVKDAMFANGAGRLGNYGHCSWQVLGEGQFMPLAESQPYLGEHDQLEKCQEYKVEMVCDEAHIHDVMVAFKNAHPYELPAYHVSLVESLDF